MTTYGTKNIEVAVSKKAQKRILLQSKKRRVQIYKAIYQLPYGTDIKRLQGYKNRYRIRIGDIRILFDRVDTDDILKIFVVDVDSRGDVYKK
jgi:mRNA interferase RelE/StbE